ncbi:hypothetical protein STVIR_3784 [Streptomyces viridochromogenes Tue57]|uniref:Uncharacterized protein n=1 Tax=Streptomyces viridochromogenes Tue57 TaxID=1160705 RepID=L8PFT7_STRVR|nr:hypothetical protein STVIR_3784 [Streptomyces viridochromogenes Tue57]
MRLRLATYRHGPRSVGHHDGHAAAPPLPPHVSRLPRLRPQPSVWAARQVSAFAVRRSSVSAVGAVVWFGCGGSRPSALAWKVSAFAVSQPLSPLWPQSSALALPWLSAPAAWRSSVSAVAQPPAPAARQSSLSAVVQPSVSTARQPSVSPWAVVPQGGAGGRGPRWWAPPDWRRALSAQVRHP